jgi:hypothetical protein
LRQGRREAQIEARRGGAAGAMAVGAVDVEPGTRPLGEGCAGVVRVGEGRGSGVGMAAAKAPAAARASIWLREPPSMAMGRSIWALRTPKVRPATAVWPAVAVYCGTTKVLSSASDA